MGAKPTGLVQYDEARRALAAARTTDEARKIRDAAAALRTYAQMAKDKTLEVDAIEIRARSERRIGQLMAAQKATVGMAKPPGGSQARPKKDRGTHSPDHPPTLADAGIDKDLAKSARKAAAIRSDGREWLVVLAAEDMLGLLAYDARVVPRGPIAASKGAAAPHGSGPVVGAIGAEERPS